VIAAVTRALLVATPYTSVAVVDATDGLWLTGGGTTFRIDDGARIRATHHHDGEQALAVVGDALIVAGDAEVRAVDIATGVARWRTPLDGYRPYMGARWWYVSSPRAPYRELDLDTGAFRDRREIDDGKPPRGELRDTLGDAVKGPVAFADTWYVGGDHELADGTTAVVQPIAGDGPQLRCRGALQAIAASSTALAVLVRRDGGMVAACWRTLDGAVAEASLDAEGASLCAVGPATVVAAPGRLLVSTVDGAAGWRALPNPLGMTYAQAATDAGRAWLVMTRYGKALLCAIDELRGLAPGAHPLTLHEHALAPAGVRAVVKSVGAASRVVVAIHPAYGRLTFIDRGTPPLAADEEIEVLERGHGSSVEWRRPGAASREPTTTVVAAPAAVGWQPPAFVSSNALARWTVRVVHANIATPPILARLFELYDRDAATRAAIIRAIGALDPDAALFEDVAALLRERGERRVLFGFTTDVERMAIGVVAGSAAVWSYDDGELVEVAASARAWIDRQLEREAAERPALVERLRALLAEPPEQPKPKPRRSSRR
jgi:hypothetical protein